MSNADTDAVHAALARLRAGGIPPNCVVTVPDFPARPLGPSPSAADSAPSTADEVAAFAHWQCAVHAG